MTVIVPGLPEEISVDQLRDAFTALGIPFDGRITETRIIPDSVEVTFIRQSFQTKQSLTGGRDSMAKVTVPIRVRKTDLPEFPRFDNQFPSAG